MRFRTLFNRAWCELQDDLLSLSANSSATQVVEIVVSWMAKNANLLNSKPFVLYNFHQYFLMNVNDYPIELAVKKNGINIDSFRKSVCNYDSIKLESIAMFLRDSLEEFFIVESDKDCPRCEQPCMGIWLNSVNKRVVYECKICGFSMFPNGEYNTDTIIIPTKKDLKDYFQANGGFVE